MLHYVLLNLVLTEILWASKHLTIGSPFQGLAGCQLWCDERRGTVLGLIWRISGSIKCCQPNFVIVFFHRKWYGRITNQKIYIICESNSQNCCKTWMGWKMMKFPFGIAYSQGGVFLAIVAGIVKQNLCSFHVMKPPLRTPPSPPRTSLRNLIRGPPCVSAIPTARQIHDVVSRWGYWIEKACACDSFG